MVSAVGHFSSASSLTEAAICRTLSFAVAPLGKYLLNEQYEGKWRWPVAVMTVGISYAYMGTFGPLISVPLWFAGHLFANCIFPRPRSRLEPVTSSLHPPVPLTSSEQIAGQHEVGNKKGGLKSSIVRGILKEYGYTCTNGAKHELWKCGAFTIAVPFGGKIAKGTACGIIDTLGEQQGLDDEKTKELKQMLR